MRSCPSLATSAFSIRDPKLVREGAQVLNDWAIEFQRTSPRFVSAATLPLLDVDDAVAEVRAGPAWGSRSRS